MFPTRVLLATDGSKEAVLAEEAAVELANGTDSELHVVYVVSRVPEVPHPTSSARERSEAFLERRRLGGIRLLDKRVGRIEEIGGSVTASYYREGNPERVVIRLGEEIEAGLIMTGGQRRPWFERIFLGAGFSEFVSKKADRPVLVVSWQGLRGVTVPG